MVLKITSTKSIPTYINCLVYGESGVGKTTLCSTAPDPFIISAEGGLLALAKHDLPVVEITSRDEINEVYDWLCLDKQKKKFKTICLDSLSEVSEVLLADEKKRNKDGRAAYGVMADEMSIAIRGFRDLPYHTYYTTKVRKLEDSATGVITYVPSVPGQQLLNGLAYFFDEVFYMGFAKTEDGTSYRYLKTVGDRQRVGKDRSGNLAEFEKPDLTHVFTKIIGENKTQTEAKKESNHASITAES